MMDRTVDVTELSIGVIDHFTSFVKDPCVDEFNASQFNALDFIPVVEDGVNRSYTRCPNDPLSSSSSIASSSFASSPNDNLHYTALLLLTFPLITLFGNVLVCLSVCVERSLRSVTNYFIVSLAIADILVAILVMPPAIYVEVNNSVWQLGDPLCDVWVAADVLCCTASILNLTAISFDRYIAITQPLFYARHKKSKRGHVMLAMTWIISVAISAPIVLGINYTDRRRNLSPNLCTFYNADFIIVSSMGSFYIPCILMLLLYCRMFRKIHLMARQSIMRRKSTRTDDDFYGGNSRKCSMEESKHPVRRSSSRRKTSEEDEKPEDRNQMEDLLLSRKQSGVVEGERPEVFLKPFKLNQTVSSANSSPRRDTRTGLDVNDVFSRDNQPSPSVEYSSNNLSPSTEYNGSNLQSERIRRYDLARSARMSITKLNSYLRRLPSQSRRDRSATKRERKVTKTLVIVLVVFLFCWAPFFTVNIINAICIRFNLFARWPVACHINPSIASAFVWLGYINSFINPIIYTIFNIEFRRAFDKLLTKPCSFLTSQKRPFSKDDLVCMSNI